MVKTCKPGGLTDAGRLAAHFGRLSQSLFIPRVCIHCGRTRWRETPLCRICSRALAKARESESPVRNPMAASLPDADGARDSDTFHFLFRRTPALSTLIHGFKYRHFERHIRFLCAHVRYRPDLREVLKDVDVLVPVPIHGSRRRERGYNQAEKIALELSTQSGVRVVGQALKRIRPTTSQTRLNKVDRAGNLSHALALGKAESLLGKRVLLIDDVYTTGATSEACAELLRQAGCLSVKVFALAKVDVDPNQNDFLLELESASAYLA